MSAPGQELAEIVTAVPGPKSRAMAERFRRVESPDATFFGQDFPVVWARANGANVWDVDGNRYVDFNAGFGAAAVGHAHPAVVEAVRRQSETLMHGMGDVHPTEVRLALSERLTGLAQRELNGDWQVIYGLNGADAVEAAIKTALKATRRPGLVAFEGGYHGLSLGALGATAWPKFRECFDEWLPNLTTFFPYPGLGFDAAIEGGGERAPLNGPAPEEVLSQVSGFLASPEGAEVGAILIEPIAGRGGTVPPPAEFLRELRRLADRHECLLIFDEIFTGFGRTGEWFACAGEAAGRVAPDLICVGKALGGGMPISACLGRAEVMEKWGESGGEARHTSTFVGHPAGCAAALAAIDLMEGGLMEEGRRKGEVLERLLRERLGDHPRVGQIRGRGMMWGIELRDPATGAADGPGAWRIVVDALHRGLILLVSGPAGNVVQLTPPLIIGQEQIDWGISALEQAIQTSSK